MHENREHESHETEIRMHVTDARAILDRSAKLNAALRAEIARWAGVLDGHPRRDAYALIMSEEEITVADLIPGEAVNVSDPHVKAALLPVWWDGPQIAAFLTRYAPEIIKIAHALTFSPDGRQIGVTPEGYRALIRLRRATREHNGADA